MLAGIPPSGRAETCWRGVDGHSTSSVLRLPYPLPPCFSYLPSLPSSLFPSVVVAGMCTWWAFSSYLSSCAGAFFLDGEWHSDCALIHYSWLVCVLQHLLFVFVQSSPQHSVCFLLYFEHHVVRLTYLSVLSL